MALKNGNPLAENYLQTSVLGLTTQTSENIIPTSEVHKYLGNTVTVSGKITAEFDHLPKAYYMIVTDDSGQIQVRVFDKDINKFTTPLQNYLGKTVKITGLASLYGPQGFITEIQISNPSQIQVIDNNNSWLQNLWQSMVNVFGGKKS